MENTDIAKYLYEMGYLKQVKRAGWGMLGIPQLESVAEHSFRTAILGYILASLAGADPERTATMCLFHDTAEARTGDLHRVARRYNNGNGEELALNEQVQRLPSALLTGLARSSVSMRSAPLLKGDWHAMLISWNAFSRLASTKRKDLRTRKTGLAGVMPVCKLR